MRRHLRLLVTAFLALPLMLATTHAAPVTRRDLLAAGFSPARALARADLKEITLAPRVAAGLHLHPCPVVGVVLAGRIAFQLEGQPARELGPGDAFCEPADTRVARFDNVGDTPATFIACYLLAPGQTELLRPLAR